MNYLKTGLHVYICITYVLHVYRPCKFIVRLILVDNIHGGSDANTVPLIVRSKIKDQTATAFDRKDLQLLFL